MQILVFSDVVCPWCYIGVSRLEQAVADHVLRTGESVDVRLRAYQLDPDAEGGTPLVDALARKFGSAEQARATFEHVTEVGRTDGIEFDFSDAVQANTFDAHRLLAWAEATGGTGAQRDLAHELWKAHFREGADVGDHDTLVARAGLVGLDVDDAHEWLLSDGGAEEVRMQIETARSLGISAVPTVVIDRTYAIAGAQSREAYAEVLAKVASAAD